MQEDCEGCASFDLDPEAVEFKEIIKNARKKLVIPTAPALPRKDKQQARRDP